MNISYQVIRSSRRSLAIEIKNGTVYVRAPFFVLKSDIDAFVNGHEKWIEKHLLKEKELSESALPSFTDEEIEALKIKAKEYIPARASYYAGLMGVEYEKITIRCQKSRFGSCSAKGNLSFNCLLMLAPKEVIDSVIVHELAHIKEMNHSKDFYREVRKVYPAYDKCNKWLKENGKSLIMRKGK